VFRKSLNFGEISLKIDEYCGFPMHFRGKATHLPQDRPAFMPGRRLSDADVIRRPPLGLKPAAEKRKPALPHESRCAGREGRYEFVAASA